MAKTQQFKTEVHQLLQLMINSLYSNRDIFLRELIANAADAIDKARFASLTDTSLARDWKIELAIDKEQKTLTISDNGIGMNEQEVTDNIGTIAQSGTKAFLKMLEESGKKADAPELIGQFGVGFYSAFMVAEKVELVTKKSGTDDPAVKWSSTGEAEYTLDSAEKSTPGTEITLYLKEDAAVYLEDWTLSSIIRKYSDFIAYPITLPCKRTDKDGKESVEICTINSQKAIWLRKPSEITEDEYKSFYNHIARNNAGEYLKAIHMTAEGNSEFKALLFLPKHAPYNILMPEIQKKGLQLYIKRVFITDECKELLPDYLRFVNGVVDSADLPLNVSREILQQNKQMSVIRENVTRKVLGELKKLLENSRSEYEKFFNEFGKLVKEGLYTDGENQEKLKDLVLYESMNSEAGKYLTLDEYVKAMPESQTDIYYISGDKRESLASNPALEYCRAKGYDVLFMTDPIDEWVMQVMFQYQKKHFKNIAKGDLDDKESEDKVKAAAEKYAPLIEFLKKELAEKVSEVKFTGRLSDSPCAIITEGEAMPPHIERLFRSMQQSVPVSKRILELNCGHPLIEALQAKLAGGADEKELGKYAAMLYDQALLLEGTPLPDPADFARSVVELLTDKISK